MMMMMITTVQDLPLKAEHAADEVTPSEANVAHDRGGEGCWKARRALPTRARTHTCVAHAYIIIHLKQVRGPAELKHISKRRKRN